MSVTYHHCSEENTFGEPRKYLADVMNGPILTTKIHVNTLNNTMVYINR